MTDAPEYRRRDLPHITQATAYYFVTWRLRRGLPPISLAERDLVANAITHFNHERYRLIAWVVMDDHVHVLFQPLAEHNLSSILHSWKSFTANRLQREYGRAGAGAIWQAESFDHLIRNEDDLHEKWQYILNNPLKRWPGVKDYAWVSKPGDARDV